MRSGLTGDAADDLTISTTAAASVWVSADHRLFYGTWARLVMRAMDRSGDVGRCFNWYLDLDLSFV